MKVERVQNLITWLKTCKNFDMRYKGYCLIDKAYKRFVKKKFHLFSQNERIEWFSEYFGIDYFQTTKLYWNLMSTKEEIIEELYKI